MWPFSKSADILGINARNLLYIARYNTRAKKHLADDKIYTKHYLHARGIGTAKLYYSLQSLEELRHFNPASLPRSFVIKPNRGYGGEGIIAIADRRGQTFIDVDGQRYSWSDLNTHCVGILDGKYAISGLHDKVIFEERLLPHEYFKKFMDVGLPDIRIIVFRYVPIIAMLRLPTPESRGKANLHLGAIGLGIDIGTGKTTFGVHHNQLIRKLPNGESVRSISIPDWDAILLTASKTQHYTQIGYLAVDVAPTNNGIKILELNARAGLAIQISNQVLLRKRLEKVADLKVVSPEEGVRIGKTLFTRIVKKSPDDQPKSAKPTIGLFEHIAIINTPYDSMLAKVDPHSSTNYFDQSLTLGGLAKVITIKLKGKKIKIPFEQADLSNIPYRAILGGKYLADFLIDITQKVPFANTAPFESREEKILLNIDKKVCSINEQINLLAGLKPVNLAEQQREFLKNPTKSPQFVYRKLTVDCEQLRNELKKIPQNLNHPFIELYRRKIREIENKLSIIEHVGEPDALTYAHELYGSVTYDQYEAAVRMLRQESMEADTSKKLRMDDVIDRIGHYLAEKKLTRWKIKILDSATADMQVNKKNAIMVRKKAQITENRLRALIAHEIETHIFRLENGRLQRYRLFEQGTASYLPTEEGLAIYNQRRLNIPLGAKHFSPALNVIAAYHGQSMPFHELHRLLTAEYQQNPVRAWQLCVRVKRGLGDTTAPGAFMKDIVYFLGYHMITNLVLEKGTSELRKLYIGKISAADLSILGDTSSWPVRFVPDYH
ncbi:MAG: DUF1704 domain-containing protein [Patescibacteria group bacterium]|nr:DUF1704 domain-containing protein [Patescibacteria group bacterium]MDD5715567.1 DUF1704 domain-containing protein [Patescibacteria group bacterium]